jgi:hypothetical protein
VPGRVVPMQRSVPEHWLARGDKAALWIGGKKSPGVYAVGTATGTALYGCGRRVEAAARRGRLPRHGRRCSHGAVIMQFTSCPSPALAKSSMSLTSVSSATTLHPIASAVPMTGSAPITCPRVAV